MFYALFIGGLLGLNHVEPVFAALVFLPLLTLKAGSEVLTKRSWFTGAPSPYVSYVELLKQKDSLPKSPMASYLFQAFAFGSLLGLVGYSVAWFVA
jgi:hypothetical protein